jgi:hypothetical protein
MAIDRRTKMTRQGRSLLHGERGAGFASVLLALLIVAVLYFGYFKLGDSSGTKSVGIKSIDVSREVACRTQRQNIERDITMWKVNHPDDPPSLAALQRDGLRVPSCPEGGRYDLVGSSVVCSKHK